MPNPLEILDYARSLSHTGIEDLQLRLLSSTANKRKELLAVLEDLLEAHANAQLVALLLSTRVIDVSKPGLMKGQPRQAKRSRAG